MSKIKVGYVCLLMVLTNSIFSFSQVTQLNNATCGMVCTAWFGDGAGNVKAIAVTGATHYRFWAKGLGVNSNYSSVKIRAGFDWIQLGQFQGMKDTTWYEIYVSVSLDNGATYGPYGVACQVKTPISGTTQLQAAYCGIQTTSNTQLLYYDTRPYVTLYRIRLKNQQGFAFYDQSITRSVNNFSLSMFSNLQAGRTYECTIQWNNGGDWKPWGQMCTITTPQLPLNPPQMPDRVVIGSAGRYGMYQSTVVSEQNSVSCTVGECFTQTYTNASYMITQGFQQPDASKVINTTSGTSVSGLVQNIVFSAFPNPFVEKITIAAPEEFKAKAIVKVISSQGQLIADYEMNESHIDLDLTNLSVGKYFVIIYDEIGNVVDNLQVVKTPNE